MKKYSILAALAATILASVSCTETKTMSDDVLMDKIKGAWAGQTIGCTYGGPTEFKYKGVMIPDSVEIAWPEHQIKWYYENEPGLYDDVYMDLTFVDVFEKKGLDAPVEEFANAFAYAGYKLWHANLQARVNIMNGIMAPESGYWKNNPHADDIDFQIEADYAGIMAPGMPNAAARYSDDIGHIMNYGEGWYGGVYVAAMYALAFVRDDINQVVEEALTIIPEQSRYHRCMADVISWHKQYPDDWKATWQLCQDNYTGDAGCIDEPGHEFIIDATLNSAYILIGLLYGQGDFDKTLEISCRCGQDSDCNPASAGGILATMLGYSKIPQKWMPNLKEVEDMPFAYTDISLNKAYELSYGHARQVIEREGGKLGDGSVTIKVQKPQTVRFEESFEGLEVKEIYDFPQPRAYDADIVHTFNGTGVVLKGRILNIENGGDYKCNIEVSIDGQLCKTVTLTEDKYRSQDHIFHFYDMEPGEHTVCAHITNPREDKPILCTRALVYGPKEQ